MHATNKPFNIDKRLVYEAYKAVKSNRGAAGDVWGRPVGVAVGNDGSLFVTDDGSRSVWRVTWVGK